VRRSPPPVSANVRRKRPLITRRADHHCAPLHIPCNRHQSQPGPNPRLVCLPLALGDDIPGSAGAFGRGNTAPVVRPCHCADDTGAARAFLADNDLGERTDCDVQPSSPSPYRRVVRKDRAHVQRRHRHSTPPSLVPVGFIDVPGRHRTHRNTGGPSQTSRRDSLLRGLKCGKSSSDMRTSSLKISLYVPLALGGCWPMWRVRSLRIGSGCLRLANA